MPFDLLTTTNAEAEAALNRGISELVVFASGVTTLDATSGSSGTDNTSALQAVLDTASASSPLRLFIDGNTRTGKLRVKGHTSIIGIGMPKMWLKNGANSPFIQNYNPSPDTITDEKIHIEGLDLECNRANQTGIGNFGTQEANGNLQDAIQMFQVRNLTIRNVIIRHAQAIPIHYSGQNIFINDIHLDNNDGVFQQGGIQAEGPTSRVVISNIVGTVFDDLIAIAVDSDQWNETEITGLGPYIGPGDCTDFTISNIVGYDAWSAVRLFGWDTSRIDRVVVRNISGTFIGYPISCRDAGNIGAFSVDGVNCTQVTSTNPLISLVDLSNCTAEQLAFTGIQWRPFDARPGVQIDVDCAIKQLTLGLDIYEDSADANGMIPIRCAA